MSSNVCHIWAWVIKSKHNTKVMRPLHIYIFSDGIMRKMRRHVICLIDMVVPLAMQLETHSMTKYSHKYFYYYVTKRFWALCYNPASLHRSKMCRARTNSAHYRTLWELRTFPMIYNGSTAELIKSPFFGFLTTSFVYMPICLFNFKNGVLKLI